VSEGAPTDRAYRLHPLSIPYRIVENGIGIVLILLFAGGPTFDAIADVVGVGPAVALGLVIVAAVVGYGIAYYRRFEYELTADTFDIRSGVLARRVREIPLRRIQNVDISQNVLQRALGIAEVRLETAGASGSEAHLKFVSEDRAGRLQREISRLSRSDAEGVAEAERFETVFEITERELGLLALVSADLRLVSALFFGASLFAPSTVSMLGPEVFFFGPETILGALFGPLVALGTILVLALVYGVVNATVYYGFRLHRAAAELRYERGLLQRYSGTIPLAKIQSLTITENVLMRALGYASLDIETAGRGGGDGDRGTSQSAIPLAERTRVFELANSLEAVGELTFERPPKRARQRYAVRYAGALALLASALYLVQTGLETSLFWWAPLGALVLVPLAAHLQWKHRGYHVGEDHVVTRNGFWVRRVTIVPYYRVQTVLSSETVFQRRRRLGTVTIDTAGARSLLGNDAKAVDVGTETIETLREQIAELLYDALGRQRRVADARSGDRAGAAPDGDDRG
jgi:putative membrane protein